MKSLTLQLAVVDAILDQTKEFSIHDLTKTIRVRLAQNEYDIIDIDDTDLVPVELNGDYIDVPNLSHKDVRISFENIESIGLLEKLGFKLIQQGAFRIYDKILASGLPLKPLDPISPSIAGTHISLGSTQNTTNINQVLHDTLEDKVVKTVEAWLDKGEEVTLRRINGTIHQRGRSVYDIEKILIKRGYQLISTNPFSSTKVLRK